MLVIQRTKTVDYEMTLQLMKTGTAETNEMRTLKSLRILFLFLSQTLSFLVQSKTKFFATIKIEVPNQELNFEYSRHGELKRAFLAY